MNNRSDPEPFHFMGCLEIKGLLGKRAGDEQELLDLIDEVPADSIYYHTHSYFLRHPYISGAYPNDFADWAAIQVRDRVLGEKLAVVTPSKDKSIEDMRIELIEIIDHHLTSLKTVPSVTYGQPFHFMTSHIIEVPLGIHAVNLAEFYETLKTVDASAVYNHVHEARMRDNLGRSDFALWLDTSLHMPALADAFEAIDSYMYSLEGLRKKLLDLCARELS